MSIYTKTGDKGTTSLFDGERVKKYSLRVDTYGTFDECCAQISVAEKIATRQEIKHALIWMEEKIFHFNAEIATGSDEKKLAQKSTLITESEVSQLETWIDHYQAELPLVDSFILPGKSLSGAQLHVARTICRRGERRLVELNEAASIRSELLQFINRLSDCLYVFARIEDMENEQEKMISKILTRYQMESSPVNNFKKDLIGFQQVQSIFESCLGKAQEINVPVALAIVDAAGNVVSSYKMKETLLISPEIARKKAFSAVAMKVATDQLTAMIQPGEPLFQLETMTDNKLVTFGGGYPIYTKKGDLIGGLGVSGGAVKEDQIVAQAGMERLKELDI